MHADLLDAGWWQAMQAKIRTGRLAEVLSYPDAVRFPPPAATRSAASAGN
jgi:isocitrate dehydrogenase kinase/phosphatase